MNDYGWLIHVQDYQSFVDEYIDDEEKSKLASSDNIMDYYKIEGALICKQGYFFHKSWIDKGKIYHHFCFSKKNISLAQKNVYEKIRLKYNYFKDNLWDLEQIDDLCDDIYEVNVTKKKSNIY